MSNTKSQDHLNNSHGGKDDLVGDDNDNTLSGGNGKDNISGLGGDDTLSGGNGKDSLFGGDDNDTISGGNGKDLITGGLGQDTMTGGHGPDTFVFSEGDSSADATAADVITDFAPGQDVLDVQGIDADTATLGDQAFAFIGTADFSAAGQLRVVQDGTDTHVEFNTAGADTAEIIIVLQNVTATDLTAGDFLL